MPSRTLTLVGTVLAPPLIVSCSRAACSHAAMAIYRCHACGINKQQQGHLQSTHAEGSATAVTGVQQENWKSAT
eukprot:355292-Chlamydomonas_euryale.AAC.3